MYYLETEGQFMKACWKLLIFNCQKRRACSTVCLNQHNLLTQTYYLLTDIFTSDIPYLEDCNARTNFILCVLGALYPDGTSGAKKQDDNVPPGGNYTYRWTVKPEFAPTQGDPNCLTWAYHSHVIAFKDISSGLIGALLTCKKGTFISNDEYFKWHSFIFSIHTQYVYTPSN